mmetsp:Transcript_30516/g.48966  ORF Transcript_30516/g.48966 Transcript_30516/m.48966 type:complete len:204 (+) Transcript_30516:126-737(+)
MGSSISTVAGSSITWQFMKPSLILSTGKSLPMKTILLTRFSPSFHISWGVPSNNAWTPWKTYFSGKPLTARIPFMRYKLSWISLRRLPSHSSILSYSTSPSIVTLTEETRSVCSGFFISVFLLEQPEDAVFVLLEQPELETASGIFVSVSLSSISLFSLFTLSTLFFSSGSAFLLEHPEPDGFSSPLRRASALFKSKPPTPRT